MRYHIAASLTLLLAAQASHAIVIDFNDAPTDLGIIETGVTISGYTFESDHYHLFDARTGEAWNGTSYIGEEGGERGYPIRMSHAGGETFDLVGFDASELLIGFGLDSDYPNSSFIDVLGTLADTTQITQRFTLDGILDGRWGLDDFQTFIVSPQFTNLISVEFLGFALDGRNGGIALDNIVVTPTSVPEPGTLLLLGAGLLGVCGARRRRV